MSEKHPRDENLRRLVSGELAGAESAAVFRHLLVHCASCHAKARRIAAAGSAVGSESEYDIAFARSLARTAGVSEALAAERLRATGLWGELERKSQAQRLYLVEREAAFRSWALVERLIEVGDKARAGNPRRSLEVSQLAVVLSNRLEAAPRPARLARDLRAAALGNLASALTLAERYPEAERIFWEAWLALEDGSGDRQEEGWLLRLEASLHYTVGDFRTAARLLRRARRCFQLVDDPHEEGRTLFQLALATGYLAPKVGIELAERALDRIELWREPRLELSVRHALIWFLNDGGEPDRALALLEASRDLYRQFEGTPPGLYQRWLEGRISRGRGDLASARWIFKAVWHEFGEAGFNRDQTLVSLDLAEVDLALGETRRALRLLAKVRTILEGWKMHTFGMAAWLLLQEAAATEAAAAQLLAREMERYFREAWKRPLPFVRRRPAGRRTRTAPVAKEDRTLILSEAPGPSMGRDLDLMAAFQEKHGPLLSGVWDWEVWHEETCPRMEDIGPCACAVKVVLTNLKDGEQVTLRWAEGAYH
ncbi:MAG TPA: tetratricopeptide repeat protein [Thermoanaerobaculia bacterium]|nr:tetratricopeptide repeat protein [Thermoanaerobaculia bacterium]